MKDRRRTRRHQAACATRTAAPTYLVRVDPVPRRALVPGAVVWAHIPFNGSAAPRSGSSEWKTRPAVVIAANGREVTLLPITGSLAGRARFDAVELRHWDVAGLTRPCAVLRRPVTLDRIDIVDLAGHLHDDDASVAIA